VKSIQVGGADVLTAGLDRTAWSSAIATCRAAGGVATINRMARRAGGSHRTITRVETVSVTDDLVVVFTEEPAESGPQPLERWSRLVSADGPFIGVGSSPMTSYLVAADDGLIALDIAWSRLWTLPLEGAQRVVRLVVTDGLVIATMPAENGAGRVMALADPTDPSCSHCGHRRARPTPFRRPRRRPRT
jgi:hypothetical protein